MEQETIAQAEGEAHRAGRLKAILARVFVVVATLGVGVSAMLYVGGVTVEEATAFIRDSWKGLAAVGLAVLIVFHRAWLWWRD